MTRIKCTLLLSAGVIGVAALWLATEGATELHRSKLRFVSNGSSLRPYAIAKVNLAARQPVALPLPAHAPKPTLASVSFLAFLSPLSAEILDGLKSQPVTQTKGRLQIGVARSLEPIVVNATTAPAAKWTSLANGWRTLSVEVSSAGALGLRVHLESISLPANAQFILFDPSNPDSAAPPITAQSLAGQTQVWTPSVFSDTVIIECEISPNADPGAVSFTVAQLSHLYTLPRSTGSANSTSLTKGEAQPCENDVTCYPAYAQSASGVALMDYVDEGNTYTCTGCLLASTDPSSVNNYFLTAHHCVGTQDLASTIELYWFYQTSTCNGTPPAISSVPTTTGGASLLATSDANDFTFLRLAQVAPSGATPLSWSINPPTTNDTLVIIHHPAGDYKRISFGNYYGSDADFWAVQWYSGVTEGGSSGGPLLNSNQQVIGQLNGGFDGPGSSCADPTAPDQFGRFYLTYPAIQKWIDPSGSGGGGGDTNVVEAVAGTYSGLFFDGGNGISQQNSGSFSLTSNAKGRFSGRLQIGSSSHTFSGSFDSTGAAQVTIGPRSSSPLSVQFQLDPEDTDEISGVVSNANFTSQLSGERAVYSESAQAPEEGHYTMAIQGDPNSSSDGNPAGNGYATVTVGATGRITMSGWLADGTRISQSATVSKSGNWPLYVPLYSGQGSLFSWVSFASASNGFTGALSWIKPGGLKSARAYPSGFTFDTTITGSPFIRAGIGNPILGFSSATLNLSSPDGTINIAAPFTLDPNNKVTNLSSNRMSLSFFGLTGAFSGRVQNPSSGQMISFSGVVLQNQPGGAGYFISGNENGPVQISPQD